MKPRIYLNYPRMCAYIHTQAPSLSLRWCNRVVVVCDRCLQCDQILKEKVAQSSPKVPLKVPTVVFPLKSSVFKMAQKVGYCCRNIWHQEHPKIVKMVTLAVPSISPHTNKLSLSLSLSRFDVHSGVHRSAHRRAITLYRLCTFQSSERATNSYFFFFARLQFFRHHSSSSKTK